MDSNCRNGAIPVPLDIWNVSLISLYQPYEGEGMVSAVRTITTRSYAVGSIEKVGIGPLNPIGSPGFSIWTTLYDQLWTLI